MLLFVFNLQQAHAMKFVQLNEKALSSVKQSLEKKTSSELTLNAYESLLEQANMLLDIENFSVTDKGILPPTKSLNDYLSISRYWWPDESKADGLPWVRRDGETNPDTQTDKVDRKRLGEMTSAVKALSYAYYFSGNDAYAKKGTELIRAWFLQEETRMNPHLNFAQSVPGNNKSRRSGILDGRLIPLWVLDSIVLFSESDHWSDDDNTQMNQWLEEYLTWLTDSKVGKSGAKQTNNHGSWYRFQVTALAWYLGRDILLDEYLQKAKAGMAQQFNDEGAQEHELKRTKSFFYSSFNLNAITRIAIIADKAGESLWNYPSSGKGELEKAINYLMPVVRGEPWPHPTKGVKLVDFAQVLGRYVEHTGSQEDKALLKTVLLDAQKKADGENYETRVVNAFALFNPSVFD